MKKSVRSLKKSKYVILRWTDELSGVYINLINIKKGGEKGILGLPKYKSLLTSPSGAFNNKNKFLERKGNYNLNK